MSQLKEFQQAAVDRIVEMLAKNQSRRFLLADEVGLGKTLIARGVIEQLKKEKTGHFTVVYLCSNLEIAAQNAEKLTPQDSSAQPLKERLTLMTLKIDSISRSKMKIYSFTPGTSLKLGRSTGIMRERRLILYLISEALNQRLGAHWKEFFRCTAGPEGWKESTRLSNLRAEFCGPVKPKFQQRWASLVRKSRVSLLVNRKDSQEYQLANVLEECVRDFHRFESEKWSHKNRGTVISELRKCLAIASLDYLDPDLVIMDEFQRFKDVLDNSRQLDSVESKLLAKPDTNVVILSATPYKMYTMKHEEVNHHQDFLETYAFLNNCEPDDPKVDLLKSNLASFRKALEQINPKESVDDALLARKRIIESDLQQVMCRTERNRYIDDSKKGITEIPADGENTTGILPHQSELTQYIQLRQFLLQDEKRAKDYGRSVMDFWKSAPSLLSFMDGHYSLIDKLRKNNEKIPRHLLLPESDLRSSHKDNLKFRQLFEKTFGGIGVETIGKPTDTDWPFLWIKPHFTYYKDMFYGDREPKKLLVFSHWHFVPKTIAFLTSSEVERRLEFDKEKPASSLLTFNKGRPYIFNVAFPSLALSRQIDVLRHSSPHSTTPSREKIEVAARKQLLQIVKDAGVHYQENGKPSKTWRIIAALEASYCRSLSGDFAERISEEITWEKLTPSSHERSHNNWFKEYQLDYGNWFDESCGSDSPMQLTINEETLQRILAIALHSPVNIVLRSLMRVSDQFISDDSGSGAFESNIELFSYVASLGLNQIRNYFNRPLVHAIINQQGEGKRYVDKVLDYCARAHLQAVIDEYVYLQLGNISGGEKASKTEKLVEQIGTMFSMHSGSPKINVSDRGRLKSDSRISGSAHFALAFGDDTHVESDGQAERQSRKSDVRTAFNSPFWPFVLATTSVGQEGLDFHLYCKDIVHWNLPSNPVDLEQREGRLNRFNSFAIRKMIARDYPLRKLVEFNSQSSIVENKGLPWQWVFDEISRQPLNQQVFKQGLYPHWIYEPSDGSNIEILCRHLMFYSSSRDIQKYKRLKRDLSIYRLVFGQPRQQDIVRRIRENLGEEISEETLNKFLPIYMINLSPFTGETVWKSAIKQSTKIISDNNLRIRFLKLVDNFVSEHSAELKSAAKRIEDLIEKVSNHHSEQGTPKPVIESAAALYYLVNPYDDVYDFYSDIGFADDLAIIDRVHSELFK